jgi:hypothetical protein
MEQAQESVQYLALISLLVVENIQILLAESC